MNQQQLIGKAAENKEDKKANKGQDQSANQDEVPKNLKNLKKCYFVLA